MTEKIAMKDKTPKESKSAVERMAESSAYAGKPGQRYIAAFLLDWDGDIHWLAEAIDAGKIVACPRCHFLHLPVFTALTHLRASDPAPVGACDVCAHVPEAARLQMQPEDLAAALAAAPSLLEEARQARATLFFDLWMGAVDGADTWLLAQMQQARAEVVALAQQPGNSEPSNAETAA